MHRTEWISLFARALVAWSFAASGVAAVAQDAVPPRDPTSDTTASALATYVAKPDATYEWRVRGRYRYHGSELVELQLHSQTWRDVVWKHQLILIKSPHVVDENRGLLIVGGGRWHDDLETDAAPDELPDGGRLFVAIARRLQTVVAVLGQVPYQPLFDRNEDKLIAYTFDQYLKTGDAEWPLLLPMVKSAVRAMDASAEAAKREWGTPLAQFTVLGGSKRGWTTWLTAAVDRRVTALAPTVIDALNMREHFPYQTRTWGKPSDKIQPYTDLNLPEILGSDAGAPLRRIVDPFEYRAAITQPKLVVLATNDRYFPVDSANLYWDALEGPKYLLYLPNNEHSISDYRRLIPSLRALHASVGSGGPLPALDWEYRWDGDGFELCVDAMPRPAHVQIWRAASASRDFRDSVWSAEPSTQREGVFSVGVRRPEHGYVATFAEAVFGRGRRAYSFSTNLAILGAQMSDDTGPRPLGLLAARLALGAAAVEAEEVVQPTSGPCARTAADRPSVGLALSGGGARGGAHIGVLKALEELRVPIDCIAGTSVGAVIGGFYASGLSVGEIEEIARGIDFNSAFSNALPRGNRSFRRKQEDYLFLANLPSGLRAGRPAGLPCRSGSFKARSST